MDIEAFRNFCLSLDGVTEKMPFGKSTSDYGRNLLVFSVADKWFCFVNIEIFDFCDIKCSPDKIPELKEQYEGIKPGYHMNKQHWISVCFNQDIPDHILLELVKASYDEVVASLSKREKETLAKNLKGEF